MTRKYLYLLGALLFIVLVVCFWPKADGLPGNLSEWQAVFLSDGQVYFGHLTAYNRSFYLLTKVYYLKYGNSLQNASATDLTAPEQKLNLIKLGGELHGPEDLMYIAQDKIEFIENLKSSSPVLQAINKSN